MSTELQELRRIAKELGVKHTGNSDEILGRVARHWHMTRSEVKEIIRLRVAKHKKPKRKAVEWDYYKDYKDYDRRDMGKSKDDILLSVCGEKCFADAKLKVPICSYCDDYSCDCNPKCSLIKHAHTKGYDKERMEDLADVFNCPGEYKKNVNFEVDDIVVGLPKIDGRTMPVFGIVSKIKNDIIEIDTLANEDTELYDIIIKAVHDKYVFTANDLLRASGDGKFAVMPTAEPGKPKKIKLNKEGYWKEHKVYFDLYDETGSLLYLRTYTESEIKKIMKDLGLK